MKKPNIAGLKQMAYAELALIKKPRVLIRGLKNFVFVWILQFLMSEDYLADYSEVVFSSNKSHRCLFVVY